MNQRFPYPLPEVALAGFCHPAPWHVFAKPARGDSEILAANGYVALRAYRGAWLDREFPVATADFLERFGKIPWQRYVTLKADRWQALDDVRGNLWFHGPIDAWRRGKLPASPVWAVDETRVRLAWLQLISRLPRCEVATGAASDSCPLFFRFSGGRGAVLPDAAMGAATFRIFQPARDEFTGERLNPRGPAVRLVQPGVNWPPIDLTES